jgi:UDP-arabinose 4-epimerase
VGDIADKDRLRGVLKHYRPVAIMHFASYSSVGDSVRQPLLYYRNNVVGTHALLEAVIEHEPLPFVFSSSCTVYGSPQKLPLVEEHPLNPINPYGVTKLVAERLLGDLARSDRLPWIALRYFNAAGSDPDGEIGEDHERETRLIPLVLAAARNGTPVQIHGADYDTPDGTCVRDYVHVIDIAEAHVCALDHLRNGGGSCAINLCNARGYSVKEVIAVAEQVCGLSVRTQVVARRPGDEPVLVGTSERARALLGWVPARQELEVQIGDAWNWLKRRR